MTHHDNRDNEGGDTDDDPITNNTIYVEIRELCNLGELSRSYIYDNNNKVQCLLLYPRPSPIHWTGVGTSTIHSFFPKFGFIRTKSLMWDFVMNDINDVCDRLTFKETK